MTRTLPLRVAALACIVATHGSCFPDPVHDHAVEALGPEGAAGTGELHRAGQPCGTCHGSAGPATTDFSVAGTVFAGATTLVGVEGARVEFTDAIGTSPPSTAPTLTNCVGNFFVKRSVWSPVFPVKTSVTVGNMTYRMSSPIGGAASCASCHKTHVTSPLSEVGPVFAMQSPVPGAPATTCAVSPVLQ